MSEIGWPGGCSASSIPSPVGSSRPASRPVLRTFSSRCAVGGPGSFARYRSACSSSTGALSCRRLTARSAGSPTCGRTARRPSRIRAAVAYLCRPSSFRRRKREPCCSAHSGSSGGRASYVRFSDQTSGHRSVSCGGCGSASMTRSRSMSPKLDDIHSSNCDRPMRKTERRLTVEDYVGLRLRRLNPVCRIDLGRLAEPISASIETGALDNECLQGGRVDDVTLVEIDGTNRLAVQTRVEEPFRILQLGPFGKRQPHGVLEGLAYADNAVVGPDGHPLGAGGLLPLHLFD